MIYKCRMVILIDYLLKYTNENKYLSLTALYSTCSPFGPKELYKSIKRRTSSRFVDNSNQWVLIQYFNVIKLLKYYLKYYALYFIAIVKV